jgi:polysaccharide pyruvyl transferase WcaK-like protein
MTRRALFVLVPPGDYTRAIPNYGDRALHEGMRSLLTASCADELIYDDWNSFPRMTLSRLLAGGLNADERMDAWLTRMKQQAGKPAPLSQGLSSALFGPAFAWLPLWALLERVARRRTGQSGRDALRPRLFPGLAARQFSIRLAACDAVVMNAGGLLADHLGHYLPGRVFALHAAQAAGRRTALLNYSFAVSRPELLEWVAPIIRRIDLHAVRESESKERLISLGVAPDRIRIAPDTAFAAESPAVRARRNSSLTIAIQARGDRATETDAWAALVEALWSRYGARVIYLCGCIKNDPPVARRLQQATARVQRGNDHSLSELKASIGRVDLLITDRYHGMIFATQMGTPFLPLASTTHKSTGYVADLGYPVNVQPALSHDSLQDIVKLVGEILERRKEIAGDLVQKGVLLKMRVYETYESLIDTLFSEDWESESSE